MYSRRPLITHLALVAGLLSAQEGVLGGQKPLSKVMIKDIGAKPLVVGAKVTIDSLVKKDSEAAPVLLIGERHDRILAREELDLKKLKKYNYYALELSEDYQTTEKLKIFNDLRLNPLPSDLVVGLDEYLAGTVSREKYKAVFMAWTERDADFTEHYLAKIDEAKKADKKIVCVDQNLVDQIKAESKFRQAVEKIPKGISSEIYFRFYNSLSNKSLEERNEVIAENLSKLISKGERVVMSIGENHLIDNRSKTLVEELNNRGIPSLAIVLAGGEEVLSQISRSERLMDTEEVWARAHNLACERYLRINEDGNVIELHVPEMRYCESTEQKSREK